MDYLWQLSCMNNKNFVHETCECSSVTRELTDCNLVLWMQRNQLVSVTFCFYEMPTDHPDNVHSLFQTYYTQDNSYALLKVNWCVLGLPFQIYLNNRWAKGSQKLAMRVDLCGRHEACRFRTFCSLQYRLLLAGGAVGHDAAESILHHGSRKKNQRARSNNKQP